MKIFSFLVVLLCIGNLLFAQPSRKEYPRLELSVGYSLYPHLAAEKFLNGHPDVTGDQRHYSHPYTGNQVHSLGLLSATLDVNLRSWLSVGVDIGGTAFWAQSMEHSGRSVNAGMVYLLPSVRFTYVRTDYFKMYSRVGFGLGLYGGFNSERTAYAGVGSLDLSPEFQVIPAGFKFGRDLYGFGELSLGTLNLGGRLGIGYCF